SVVEDHAASLVAVDEMQRDLPGRGTPLPTASHSNCRCLSPAAARSPCSHDLRTWIFKYSGHGFDKHRSVLGAEHREIATRPVTCAPRWVPPLRRPVTAHRLERVPPS